MGVVCAQPPLESELLQRCQQLKSRLSTLKIENEEVRHTYFVHTNPLSFGCSCVVCCSQHLINRFTDWLKSSTVQVKKTMEATLSTIQDMVTVEDYDVSECFHHSNSMESVKSTFSESYLSKPSLAKRRANQQETEQFYFTVSDV